LFLVCPNRDSSTSLVLDTTRYVERVIAGGWRGNGGGSARRPLGREPETGGRNRRACAAEEGSSAVFSRGKRTIPAEHTIPRAPLGRRFPTRARR
jgi:hypothetical protein